MKILDKEIPLKILKVYKEWLNIMELQHNEMVFTMFIEDVLKATNKNNYTIIDVRLEKLNYDMIYINYSQIIEDTVCKGFYYTIFDSSTNHVVSHFLNDINRFYYDYIRN